MKIEIGIQTLFNNGKHVFVCLFVFEGFFGFFFLLFTFAYNNGIFLLELHVVALFPVEIMHILR